MVKPFISSPVSMASSKSISPMIPVLGLRIRWPGLMSAWTYPFYVNIVRVR